MSRGGTNIRSVIAGNISHLFSDGDGLGDDDLDDNGDAIAPTVSGGRRKKRVALDIDGIDDALVDDIANELDIDEDDNEWEEQEVAEQADDEDEQQDDAASAPADAVDPADADSSLIRYSSQWRICQSIKAKMPAFTGASVPKKKKRRARNAVNFGIKTVLDRIDAPLYAEDDWLWNRDAAHTVADEDARTQQAILKLTTTYSRTVPPVRGARNKYVPPVALTHVRFERWMLQTTPKLYTTNVVSTFHLGGPVHLFYIVNRLLGVCFNPRCFAAAKLRCSKGTHLIFSGGSVVCAGANSVQMSRIACIDCTTLLTRIGIQAEVSKFTVQNVVSTADAGFQVDLFALAIAYPINAHHDPDCFPGLMFRLSTSQLVFIVFKSGKCIITGVSSRSQSLVAWRWFHSRILWEFEMKATVAHESEADYRRRWRQQSSMVQSMCESVRDITTARIASLLDGEAEHADKLRDIYGTQSHYDDMLTMAERVGHAYEHEQSQVLDLEEWLDKSSALDAFAPASQ